MSSQTAVVKQAIKSVGADTQKVPGSNTHTVVWVLGDLELGSEPTDVEYFHVEKIAHKSHPNVTMVTFAGTCNLKVCWWSLQNRSTFRRLGGLAGC